MRKTYLPLSDEDRNYLKSLSKKRTIQAQVVDRARILLYKADGMTFQEIADKLAISTATVRLCVSKFHKGGLDAALFDVQRSGVKVKSFAPRQIQRRLLAALVTLSRKVF